MTAPGAAISPRFSAYEVRFAAGVGDKALNPSTLSAWKARGVVELEHPDATGWQRYTLRDLCSVVALAELMRIGVVNRPMANELAAELFRKIEGGQLAVCLFSSGTEQGVESVSEDDVLEAINSRLCSDDTESAATISVSVAKLAKRVVARLRTA